jgi:hypothetical protein
LSNSLFLQSYLFAPEAIDLSIQLHFYEYQFLALRANTVEDYLLDCTAVGAFCGTACGKAHSHHRRRIRLAS